MRTIALLFAGLVLFAQDKPAATTMQNDTVLRTQAAQVQAQTTQSIEELQAKLTQLEQTVAQKDQQIAAMQANIVASQKMFGACFQSLADAEQRAAAKKP